MRGRCLPSFRPELKLLPYPPCFRAIYELRYGEPDGVVVADEVGVSTDVEDAVDVNDEPVRSGLTVSMLNERLVRVLEKREGRSESKVGSIALRGCGGGCGVDGSHGRA
jgi:hypothetical protein